MTMNEITLNVNEQNEKQTVSARELYKGLEITDRFNRWFESLLKYGFIENEDFCRVKTSTQQNQYGGEKEIDDFAISLDMAKEICMLQRSEKGKQYRQYLIKLEQAWNTPEMVMKRALQIANRQVEEMKEKLFAQEPKVLVYDNLVDRNKLMNFRDFATKIGMSQTEFMNILKSKYIYKTPSGEYRAYADYTDFFSLRTFNKGKDKTGEQLLLNMNGINFFLNKFKNNTAISA